MMRKEVAKLIESSAIFQAPMAGITTPELVSEVSNQGGIGNIGAGYLDVANTNEFIQEVRLQTKNIFGINLFVPEKTSMTEAQFKKAKQGMEVYAPKYSKDLPNKINISNVFDEQIDLMINRSVPIVSFTFGLPSTITIERLKKADIYVIGTATTVQEAMEVEKFGCDAVVVQGSEAGGHQGSFLGGNQLIGLMSLIPQVVDAVTLPVIATGGIMDSRGFKAAQCLGAATVQLGSAFLMTTESNAHDLHKAAILKSVETDTVITKAFSGKPARGIKNEFIRLYEKNVPEILAYPYQNSLTKELRKSAKQNNDIDFMSLWAGQSVRLSKSQSVKELLKELKE